jgi:hypothetical protein
MLSSNLPPPPKKNKKEKERKREEIKQKASSMTYDLALPSPFIIIISFLSRFQLHCSSFTYFPYGDFPLPTKLPHTSHPTLLL